MPKAYSYLRFSSPEQAKGDSFRRQTALAEQYAAENGLEMDTELTFHDLGVSAFRGRNSKTGALGLFLRAVEDGVVEPGSVLLVESLDRVSRQTPRKALRVLEEIVEGGVTVVTLSDRRVHTEATLDDPVGLLGSLLIFMRANEESAMKAQRLRASWVGKRAKAKASGTRATKTCPEWLRPTEAGGFAVIQERAAIVRRIFDETAEGAGQHKVAEGLNAEAVPTWRGGRVWHRTYVRRLLENPAVVGTMVFHASERDDAGKLHRTPVETVERYFPRIVDEEVWHRVQVHLGRAGATVAPRGRHAARPVRSLLARLARCPTCGEAMTRVAKGPKGGRVRLVCADAKVGGGCPYTAVPLDAVEDAIWRARVDLIEDAPPLSDTEERLGEQLRKIELELSAVVEERGELTEARRAGRLTQAQRQREAALYQEQQALEDMRSALLAEATAAASPMVAARMGRLADALEKGPQEDLTVANGAMREVFEAVTVDHLTETLRFHWKHGGETRLSYTPPFNDEREPAGRRQPKRTGG